MCGPNWTQHIEPQHSFLLKTIQYQLRIGKLGEGRFQEGCQRDSDAYSYTIDSARLAGASDNRTRGLVPRTNSILTLGARQNRNIYTRGVYHHLMLRCCPLGYGFEFGT